MMSTASQVVVYHGTKRAAEIEAMQKADVVLTTYSILESEWRKETQPCKVTCAYCQKKYYPERLKVHLRWAPHSSLLLVQEETTRGESLEGPQLSNHPDWCSIAASIMPMTRTYLSQGLKSIARRQDKCCQLLSDE